MANMAGREAAGIEHASLGLDRSDYDGLFEKSYLAIYDRSERLLKLAYDLPSMDVLPSAKSPFGKSGVNVSA